MASIDNKQKSEHGAKAQSQLFKLLESLHNYDFIVKKEQKYRIGDPEYMDDQFYFQVLIEFRDSDKWILHSTTSIRDRIKEQQWDAYNIKRLNPYVKKAYVVVPDNIADKEKDIAKSYNEQIETNQIYSAIDGVVSLKKLDQMVREKGSHTQGYGHGLAMNGLRLEDQIVEILNDKQNLELWKNQSQTAVGYYYDWYLKIVNTFDLNPENTSRIIATSKLPKLPSGGSPKTDVYVEAFTLEGKNDYTISCKKSSAKQVSVHEYTADKFCDVLDKDDNELRRLLNAFQEVGGVKALNKEDAKKLEKKLSGCNEKLTRWVLSGEGGDMNAPEKQLAKYIVTVNAEDVLTIKTIEEYIKEYKEENVKGQFGTYFKWTYPHKKQGQRIQLKMKIL